MAKLKFSKEGMEIELEENELKGIMNSYFDKLFKSKEITPTETIPRRYRRKREKWMTPEFKQEIINYCLAHPKKTYASIAKKFQVSDSFISSLMLKQGVSKWREPPFGERKIFPRIVKVKNSEAHKVVDFIQKNPFMTYEKIGSIFGLPRTIVNDIALSAGIRKHRKREKKIKLLPIPQIGRKKFERISPTLIQEVKDYMNNNPNLSLIDVSGKLKIPYSTLYHHLKDFYKKFREVKIKGKLPPEIPSLPPQIRRYKPKEYYIRTEEIIEKTILSDKVPEIFKLKDVYETVFESPLGADIKKNRNEAYSRCCTIRRVLNKLQKKGFIILHGQEPIILKGEVIGDKKRYIWKKIVKPEEVKKEEGIFPNTDKPYKEVIDCIRQAIHDGKLTYLKDGEFLGFDRRRNPDTRWFNLITYIAHLIKREKLAKDVKIDFQTKGLIFEK